jgi:hypothetical protein
MLSSRCAHYRCDGLLWPCLKFENVGSMVAEIDAFKLSVHEGKSLISDKYRTMEPPMSHNDSLVLLLLGTEMPVWDPPKWKIKLEMSGRECRKANKDLNSEKTGAFKNGHKVMFCIREFCHRTRVNDPKYALVEKRAKSLTLKEAELLTLISQMNMRKESPISSVGNFVKCFQNHKWTLDPTKKMDDMKEIMTKMAVMGEFIEMNNDSSFRLIENWELVREALSACGMGMR